MNDTTPEQAPDRQRFLTLQSVADELNTSQNQIYALVRKGELAGIKIGGRGQWRVGRDDLENYIERLYAETRTFIEQHPYDEAAAEAEEGAELLAMRNPQPPATVAGHARQTPAKHSPSAEPDRDIGQGL